MRNNFIKKYLFRKDLIYKIREKLLGLNRKINKNFWTDQKNIFKSQTPLIIFDVGAHHGKMTSQYSKLFQDAIIYPFEPFPGSVEILKMKFKTNPNIHIQDIALGDKQTTSSLFVSDHTNLNSLQKPLPAAWGFEKNNQIKVAVETLDNFLKVNNIPQIDIFKLDVQGNELPVLQGATETLKANKISLILIEWQVIPLYENHTLQHEISKILFDNDFTLFNLYEVNEARSGQIRWADAIYLHNKMIPRMIEQFGTGPGSGYN